MNMQMTPASTHSLSSEIHLLITNWSNWLQGCDIRNISDFKLCFWDCLWLEDDTFY